MATSAWTRKRRKGRHPMNDMVFVVLLMTIFAAIIAVWANVDLNRSKKRPKKGVHK